MPTVSLDGMVYHADELDRRQLVHIAPSVEVSHLIQRVRTRIDDEEEHDISLVDLPDDTAGLLLFSITQGEATVEITDADSVVATFVATKMILSMQTPITGFKVTGTSADPVTYYDLILGAIP